MTPSRLTPGSGRLRLGELLVKAGVITETQLLAALTEQKQWGGKLGDLLVRMNYMSEDIFVRALSKQLGLIRADLATEIPPSALATLPDDWVQKHETLPIALVEDGKALVVATSDPLNFPVLDDVRSMTGLRVVAQVAGASAIRNAITRAYRLNPTREDRPVRPGASVPPRSRTDTSGIFRPHSSPPPPPAEITSPVPQVDGAASPPVARSDPRLVRVAGGEFVLVNEPAGGTPSPARPPAVNPNTQTMPPARPPPAPPAPPSQPAASQAPPSRSSASAGQAFFTPPHGLPVPTPRAPASASGVTSNDEAQRQAMKALVELLISKGVFSLEEYLNRLKR